MRALTPRCQGGSHLTRSEPEFKDASEPRVFCGRLVSCVSRQSKPNAREGLKQGASQTPSGELPKKLPENGHLLVGTLVRVASKASQKLPILLSLYIPFGDTIQVRKRGSDIFSPPFLRPTPCYLGLKPKADMQVTNQVCQKQTSWERDRKTKARRLAPALEKTNKRLSPRQLAASPPHARAPSAKIQVPGPAPVEGVLQHLGGRPRKRGGSERGAVGSSPPRENSPLGRKEMLKPTQIGKYREPCCLWWKSPARSE